MKTTPSLLKLPLLAYMAATLITGPVFAQSAMRQGDHEIIIRGSAKIQESLKAIESDSSERWTQLDAINAEFETQFARFQDPSLTEEERGVANAKALEARAKLNKMVTQLTDSNLERFEIIDNELEGMVGAARNLDESNEAVREQAAEINAQTRTSLANQDKLVRVIEDVRDGTVTEASKRELKASHNLHAGAVQADKALKEALKNRNQAAEMQNLREIVAQRRNHLLQMKNVAEGNLKIIRIATVAGMTWEAFSELDQALASFTSLEDPLALETIMRPGIDAQLIRGGGGYNGASTTPSTRTTGGSFNLDNSAFGDLAP